jgi:methylated-DNA-[protein]-cysteine S-methyltransferase
MSETSTKTSEPCVYQYLASPLGRLTLVASDSALHSILWPDLLKTSKAMKTISALEPSKNHPVCSRTALQLNQYFRGERISFEIPLVLKGTAFQKEAWEVLLDIPYCCTLSYQEQAMRLGGKGKVRAVGRANGTNPIPIIVPCHRVLGKYGDLTGFAGGLKTKAYLLQLESTR